METKRTNIKSVEWLNEHLSTENIVILDASIPKVTATTTEKIPTTKRIKGARFFDIKTAFSNTSSVYPNTVPSAEKFTASAQKLGINSDSFIVVYDSQGIYSSARAWYLFKAMGYKNVVVLNGGLPAWEKAGFSTTSNDEGEYKLGNFQATYDASYFYNTTDVLSKLQDNESLILDARAQNRFDGSVKEPREGLRSGHIPSSKNMPFTSLLQNGILLPTSKLHTAFKAIKATDKSLVFTCGSGVTACVLALAATELGIENTRVYDGSWTEWGSKHELPIEKS